MHVFLFICKVVTFWAAWLLLHLIFYGFPKDSAGSKMSVDKGLEPEELLFASKVP